MSDSEEAIHRLLALVENEENRAAVTNERLEKSGRVDPVHKVPFRTLPILTSRDIRAALTNDEEVLAEYWRRDALMQSLSQRREEA